MTQIHQITILIPLVVGVSVVVCTGMLMFGVTTAIIFAVIQRLIETRYVDLRA